MIDTLQGFQRGGIDIADRGKNKYNMFNTGLPPQLVSKILFNIASSPYELQWNMGHQIKTFAGQTGCQCLKVTLHIPALVKYAGNDNALVLDGENQHML